MWAGTTLRLLQLALILVIGCALWYAFGNKGTAKKRRIVGSIGCLALCTLFVPIVPIYRSAVFDSKDAEPVVGTELLQMHATEIADLITKHPIPLEFEVFTEATGSGLTLQLFDARGGTKYDPDIRGDASLRLLSIAINQNGVTAELGVSRKSQENSIAKEVVRGFFYWYTGVNDEERESVVKLHAGEYVRFSKGDERRWGAIVWRIPARPGDFSIVNMTEDGTILWVLPGE
jgi:hypothetical protein